VYISALQCFTLLISIEDERDKIKQEAEGWILEKEMA